MKRFSVVLCWLIGLLAFFSVVSCPGNADGGNVPGNPSGGGEEGEPSGGGEPSEEGEPTGDIVSSEGVSVLLSGLNSPVSLSAKINGSAVATGATWKIESQLNDGDLTLNGSSISASAYGAAVVSAQSNDGGKAFLAVACLPISKQVSDKCLVFASSKPFVLNTENRKKNWDGALQVSTDASTWVNWIETGENEDSFLTAVESGRIDGDNKNYYILVRGSGNTKMTGWIEPESIFDLSAASGFSLNAKNADDGVVPVFCFGDIRTLLDYENVDDAEMAAGAFSKLFGGCSGLVNAPALPSPVLSKNCYQEMFVGNTPGRNPDDSINVMGMVDLFMVPPELPATTLAERCYDNMFACRISMEQAPELPATVLAEGCYVSMFGACVSLKYPPSLPATTLAPGCYSIMFNECIALDGIVKLPAPVSSPSADDGCLDSMYYACDNLKLSETRTGDYQNDIVFPYASGMGVFMKTGGTFTGDPVAGRTYYTSNKVIM